MKIRYNGHSCFTVIADDGTIIVTDPYESGGFGGGIGYLPVDVEPDIVTISHETHGDHNYTAGFKEGFVKVVGATTALGIDFRVLETFHDESQGSERGPNNIICFTVDGVTVCHLGDLGHRLSAEQIEALGAVDVMLAPIGGFYTIDANQATDIVERLRPKITIPMHYKTEKCGFPIAEVESFTKGKVNAKMIDSDEIELKADKLPGEPEILVLKHRL
jgi:L-ascorbate metabolism protein UlaG (beta-lactamase superfamily)